MRYLLVGSGNIAKTWTLALERMEGDLVGCVSRSGNRPQNARSDLPVYPSITAVDRPFDAVILTTPNGLHRAGAVEAATLGKHVLTEKPLDITRPAMQAILDAHARAGTVLAVSFQRRTRPDNLALKALFSSQALGRVIGADLSCRFWRDQAYYDSGAWRGGWEIDGGGPFLQQAIHNLDLYRWFFGSPDEVVGRTGTFLHDIEVEDHGAAILRHGDGMIGTVVASTCARPGYPARLEVTTENGCFTTLDDRITAWDVDGVPNPGLPAPTPASAPTAAVSDTSGHEAILRDFEAAVATGRPPLVSGEEAFLATDLVLRIYGR
jgi:predicted dehydrogenase